MFKSEIVSCTVQLISQTGSSNIATFHCPNSRDTTCTGLSTLKNTHSVLNVFSQFSKSIQKYKHVNICMYHVSSHVHLELVRDTPPEGVRLNITFENLWHTDEKNTLTLSTLFILSTNILTHWYLRKNTLYKQYNQLCIALATNTNTNTSTHTNTNTNTIPIHGSFVQVA